MSAPDARIYGQLLEKAGDEKRAWDAWQRWKCRTDLYYLTTEVLGWGEARRAGKPLIDPVFHRWLCRKMEPRESMLMLVPRWHLKTSFLRGRIVQEILNNPYIRIGLLSLTGRLSRMSLGGVAVILSNPKLRKIFPDLLPNPGKKYSGWGETNEEALTVYRPPREGYVPQEPQLSVYGTESVLTGLHFDWFIGDDILDYKTIRSPALMEKTEEWYRHARGIMDPTGWESYIGTHYHHQDLYTKIRSDGDIERIFIRSAVENGRPIYRFFTHALLEKYRKRMQDYVFQCQMYNNPVPSQDRLFPPPQPVFEELPAGKYRYYITVDPAATTKVYSDETAVVVVAVNEVGVVYVVEAVHFKKPGDEIAKTILELNEKYHPEMIGIELGLQEHLLVIIDMVRVTFEKLLNKRIQLPITAVKIDPGRGKYDRFNLTLGAFVRSGKLKIHERLRDLMLQMEFITPNYKGKDDLVDALSMVFIIVKQFSYGQWRYPLATTHRGWAIMDELFRSKQADGWEARFKVD